MFSLASFLNRFAKLVIIEFVPKQDSQVRRLLATREDIFPHYDIEHFEQEFTRCFKILDARRIEGSERTLFVLERR
jgi:hypothetical protein